MATPEGVQDSVQQIKKLPCDHIFHKSCLRSWFQRQQTCPTCRTSILRFPAQPVANQQQQQPVPPHNFAHFNAQVNGPDAQAAPAGPTPPSSPPPSSHSIPSHQTPQRTQSSGDQFVFGSDPNRSIFNLNQMPAMGTPFLTQGFLPPFGNAFFESFNLYIFLV